jgi:hypothetical protein
VNSAGLKRNKPFTIITSQDLLSSLSNKRPLSTNENGEDNSPHVGSKVESLASPDKKRMGSGNKLSVSNASPERPKINSVTKLTNSVASPEKLRDDKNLDEANSVSASEASLSMKSPPHITNYTLFAQS